jgi:2-keto-4-pentenoate hydratase
MRGAVLAPRLFSSPAEIDAASMPLLGIEAEIAFRFLHALPPRAEAYTADEVAAAVVAVPAIEVVDTRFASYAETPLLHRLGDCMSNGGLVVGEPRSDWRSFDFRAIPVTLKVGAETIRKTGGHSAGDPLLPAIAFANAVRKSTGIAAGQVVTTGTFTGLVFAKPGDRVSAEFEGFGRAELTFRA